MQMLVRLPRSHIGLNWLRQPGAGSSGPRYVSSASEAKCRVWRLRDNNAPTSKTITEALDGEQNGDE